MSVAASVSIMIKRTALLLALSSVVFACTAGTADESADTSIGAASAGTTMDAVYAGVTQTTPKCYEKQYSADHLARHPKQTVSAIRIQLTQNGESSFEPADAAKITFQQKGQGPKIRELGCAMVNGQVLCTEDPTCKSSVVLVGNASGGLRMTNKDLRASGACDVSPKPLDASSGADDVFDLVPVACDAGVLANPPTVSCEAALANVRACIDVMDQKCDNMISKGERYADEFQLSAVEGKRLESAEECIQRFTDVVAADGCCGG